ncbi:hypothetical protein A2U01_0059814, partial [Trifolium medium]|nr:hypothetical protein [Trifolium medium]
MAKHRAVCAPAVTIAALNNWVWNGEKEIGQQLGNKALRLWEEWLAAQIMRNRATQTVTEQQQTQWHKPNFGWFKCNVDAKTSLGV